MGLIIPPEAPLIVEPENLETIWIDGILAPDFDRNLFIIRCFEDGVINGRHRAIVRVRVAMSPNHFRGAIRMANVAATHSMTRRTKKLLLV